MRIEPMAHMSDSSNLAFYAESAQPDGYIWAEVCRNDFYWPGGVRTTLPVPTFTVTVHKHGTGELVRFRYEPKTRPADGSLSPRTVTRLIRARVRPS